MDALIDVGTIEQVADGEPEKVSILAVIVEDLESLVRDSSTSPEVDQMLSVPLDELLDDGTAIGTATEKFGELKIPARRMLRKSDLVPGLINELGLVRDFLSKPVTEG